MGCIVYTDYVYLAFVTLHADSSCLFLLFGKWFVFVCFPLLFHHAFFLFLFFGLLALSYLLVRLPDLSSHFAFLFSSAFVYIPMLCHWLSWIAICFIKSVTLWTHLQKKKKKKKKKGGGGTKEDVKILSYPMSEAWSAVSGLHSQRIEWELLLSQLPCGHSDETVS